MTKNHFYEKKGPYPLNEIVKVISCDSSFINKNNISVVISKQHTLGGNPDNDITMIIVEKLNKVLPSLNLK